MWDIINDLLAPYKRDLVHGKNEVPYRLSVSFLVTMAIDLVYSYT